MSIGAYKAEPKEHSEDGAERDLCLNIQLRLVYCSQTQASFWTKRHVDDSDSS